MDTPISTKRHSLAHIMASAVQHLMPHAQFGVGPVTENGFYYDIDLGEIKLSKEDFAKIEKEMRKIIAGNHDFVKEMIPIADAIARVKKAKQTFKASLLEDLKKHGTTVMKEIDEQTAGFDANKKDVSEVSFYKTDDFEDLCRGPHVENTKELSKTAFKLWKVAGAYWRGKEDNAMLTRLYGLAFDTQKELDDYLTMLAEAEKRDHKKLGPALDLFVFSDLVGQGLPLWTPKGTLVRNLLDSYVWELRKRVGYMQVEIPHITKKELYEKSGHWEKFKDDLFKIETREGHIFAMKPMNCPHHTQIYNRRPWSYRDLPQRYANTTMVYRDEQSGELAGLARVRAITQDDAHVFCRISQAQEEFLKIWDIIHEFYSSFGFELRVRLSLHDPAHPEKYLGDPERWKQAEQMIHDIAKEKKANASDAIGEAAFYGPKVDFMAKDSIGREHQVATIQLDLNMPERFDLTCVNEQGEKERIVMVHAAIMGSIERFLAVLIEHTAGKFPVWLSPVQARVLPVSEKFLPAAQKVSDTLATAGFRAEVDSSDEKLGKKIRAGEMEKIPYLLVMGEKEESAGTVAVRSRDKGDEGTIKVEQFIERLQKEIAQKV